MMKIICTKSERDKLLDLFTNDVVCRKCLVEDLCNRNVNCIVNLKRNIQFEIVEEVTAEAKLANKLKKLIGNYIWLQDSYKAQNHVVAMNYFKSHLQREWDELNWGVSSQHLDAIAKCVRERAYLKPNEFLSLCKRVARGEKV